MAKDSKTAKDSKKNVSRRKVAAVSWAAKPAAHDYPAAGSYLGLLAAADVVEVVTSLLSQAPTVHQHAKDILRAAGLPLLGADDAEVAKDLARVAAGTALSPVLLVRGDLASGRRLQIADGYHRVCASYHLSDDTEVPCRLVSVPGIAI
jgi:DNA-binding transcriptional LysR family regulator